MMVTMVMHEPGADLARGDQIVVLRGASWADYQRVMEIRGDRAVRASRSSMGCSRS